MDSLLFWIWKEILFFNVDLKICTKYSLNKAWSVSEICWTVQILEGYQKYLLEKVEFVNCSQKVLLPDIFSLRMVEFFCCSQKMHLPENIYGRIVEFFYYQKMPFPEISPGEKLNSSVVGKRYFKNIFRKNVACLSDLLGNRSLQKVIISHLVSDLSN